AVLGRLFEDRFRSVPEAVADVAHLDSEARQVHEIQDQGALDGLFQHFLKTSAQPIGSAIILDTDDPQRNFLKVRSCGLEKDVCRQDRAGERAGSTEHETDKCPLVHPALSPTLKTISTS